jgi:hypothetical protein
MRAPESTLASSSNVPWIRYMSLSSAWFLSEYYISDEMAFGTSMDGRRDLLTVGASSSFWAFISYLVPQTVGFVWFRGSSVSLLGSDYYLEPTACGTTERRRILDFLDCRQVHDVVVSPFYWTHTLEVQ